MLVEDDAMLGDAVCAGLTQDGARVDWVRSLSDARLALVEHDYKAVLLDLGLPEGSGLKVLASMRARYDATPVLIITARDRLSERVAGLDAGADDYIVAVPARRTAGPAARRPAPQQQHRGLGHAPGRCGDRTGPPDRHARRQEVSLSAHEYRTLLALMERMGQTVSREQLEVAVYGGSGTIESNTVAVYVHQLRRKLGEGLIVTAHGVGYRIETGDTP